MEDAWRGIEFDVQPYKKTLTFVVRNVDEFVPTHAHARASAGSAAS